MKIGKAVFHQKTLNGMMNGKMTSNQKTIKTTTSIQKTLMKKKMMTSHQKSLKMNSLQKIRKKKMNSLLKTF